jgi:DNA invertase Pin-like site-specific DNA recombinase
MNIEYSGLVADAYCRYSSKMQDDGNSIEYQIAEIEEFCIKNGIKIRKWHIDKAVSGKKVAGRDQFYNLIEDVKAKKINALIVWKTNRAFRNSYESHKYRKVLRKYGVKLISATQIIDEDTSTGRLTTNILSDIDQYQSEVIADHVKSAMREMVRRGFYTGQTIPYGYKVEDTNDNGKPRKKYIINEEEAVYVKRIFEEFANGLTIAHISRWMKAEGLKTRRGNVFDYDALRKMLKNDFYIGTRRYTVKELDTIEIENAVPPIIDERTFDAVQHVFLSRKKDTKPRSGKRTYGLTGKIVCAYCNEKFYGKAYANSPYYHCKNKVKKKTCDCKSIRKDKLEKKVLQEIKENILNAQSIEFIAEKVLKEIGSMPTQKVDRKELLKRKETLLREIKELVQLKLDGLINAEALRDMQMEKNGEIADIDLELALLEDREEKNIDKEFIVNYLNDLISYSNSDNDEILKVLFDKTVDKIVISNSGVELHLAVFFTKYTHKTDLAFPKFALSRDISRYDINKL